MQRIKGYHAHVYYDAATMEQARELCEEAARLFPVTMGRIIRSRLGHTRTGVASWRSGLKW